MAGLLATLKRRPLATAAVLGVGWWLWSRSAASKDPLNPQPPPEPAPGELPVAKTYKSVVSFDQGGTFEVQALRGGNFCLTRSTDGAMEMYSKAELDASLTGLGTDARDLEMVRANGFAGFINVYKGAAEQGWAFDIGEAEALWGSVRACQSSLTA